MSSENGWPAPPNEPTHLYAIGGTDVKLSLLDNYAGFCLAHLAQWYNDNIHRLEPGQCWGGVQPRVIPGSHVYSNHGAWLAIDLNSLIHPSGRHGTFNDKQIGWIHDRLFWMNQIGIGGRPNFHAPPGWTSNAGGPLIRWGGDYQRAPLDTMHFEWNRSPAAFVPGKRLALHLTRTPRGREILKLNAGSKFARAHG